MIVAETNNGMQNGDESFVGIAGVLAPLVERWGLVMRLTVGAPALAILIMLVWPRSYQARVTVATIVSSSQGFNLGGAAALLSGGLGGALGASTGGVQASPALVSNLMQSRRVLTEVGAMPAPGG